MLSFILTFTCFKLPREIVEESYKEDFSTKAVIKGLLAQADTGAISLEEQSRIDQTAEARLLSSSSREKTAPSCIQQGNLRSPSELQEGLQKAPQGNEDFGRYVGYGWQEFTRNKNIFYPLLKLLFPTSDTCYSLNQAAQLLCSNSDAVDNFEIKTLKEIYANLKDKESKGAVLLQEALKAFEASNQSNYNPLEYRDHIVALRQFYQSFAIKSNPEGLAVPYRYLVPYNIIFNRSLQNLSSYYTDLGFSWILIFFMLLFALPYAIYKREKTLIALSLTTLIGRGIWWEIASAILRYGTVLISWTMMTLTAFFISFHEKKTEKKRYLIIALLLLAIAIQLFLNIIRIASQGASGPFVQYKGSVGHETLITKEGSPVNKQIFPYTAKHVFDLQFPQYNPIISALKERADEEGVLIEGTYIQYFLHNQRNLQFGASTKLREYASDNDLCKAYWRFKQDKISYFIIDQNIGTVGMGEGNETLFHRFFAKLNPIS